VAAIAGGGDLRRPGPPARPAADGVVHGGARPRERGGALGAARTRDGLRDAPTSAGAGHGQVERHVAVLLDFARRHPQARFPIDDESGTSLSLLLVVRQELADCDPAHLPDVERLLPRRFRAPTAPPT
jgi:hypothetical protein